MKLAFVQKFLVLIACAAAPLAARAHPMGNFSINHYAHLLIQDREVLIRYRLDLAEIATAQEMPAIDTDGDQRVSDAERAAYLAKKAPDLLRGLELRVDGHPVPLSLVDADLQIRPGAADLPTFLITVNCRAALSDQPLPAGKRLVIQYKDGNYPERDGWREVTAWAGAGFHLLRSDAAGAERSGGLEAYPPNPTEAPPQQREARVEVEATGFTSSPASQQDAATTTGPASARNTATPQDPFTRLISADRIASPGFVLASLLIAFALGSFHALAPGHGKTVVAAYLVGSRGTPRHAVLLGLVVTMTHVAGVLLLGLVVLFASAYVLPERLYPWLGFVSGFLILALGVWQFSSRYAMAYLRARGFDGPGFVGHVHGPGGHTHDVPDRITLGSLVALGVSGGMVPCPSALVVMLASIALHRVAFGLLLVVTFSFGLAAVLIAIGLLMLYARRLLDRFGFTGGKAERVQGLLRLISPAAVAMLGLVIAAQSVRAGGLLNRPAPSADVR